MPLEALVQFLDRKTDMISRPRLHTAIADVRHKVLVLFIESDTAHPVSMNLELDWNEIFGVIPCEVCGKDTPVESITVCRTCGASHPAAKKDDTSGTIPPPESSPEQSFPQEPAV